MENSQYLGDGSSLEAEPQALVGSEDVNELTSGASSYELWDDPKTTSRADSKVCLQQERVCKQCGKGFRSLKALCGHMACHSKERVLRDSSYWACENSKLVDNHSDTEDYMIRKTRSKTKRYKKTIAETSDFGSYYDYSYVSDIEQEKEDAAMCLIMLSRDTRKWGGVNSVLASSNNIEIITGKSDDLGLADEICEMKKISYRKFKCSALDMESLHFESSCSGYVRNGVNLDISSDDILRYRKYKDARSEMIYNKRKHDTTLNNSQGMDAENECAKVVKFDTKRVIDLYDNMEPSKNAYIRKFYVCINCDKSFNSFQALGGHRPCHKKANSTFHLDYESNDNCLEDDDITPISQRFNTKKPIYRAKSKKNKGQKCPFCPRMFKSGQALGGHKRTHFINSPGDFHNTTQAIRQEVAAQESTICNSIDLNILALEQDNEFDDNNLSV